MLLLEIVFFANIYICPLLKKDTIDFYQKIESRNLRIKTQKLKDLTKYARIRTFLERQLGLEKKS